MQNYSELYSRLYQGPPRPNPSAILYQDVAEVTDLFGFASRILAINQTDGILSKIFFSVIVTGDSRFDDSCKSHPIIRGSAHPWVV